MGKRRKFTVNKTAVKKLAGCCHFCGCDVYETLDLHRIVLGEDGGRYTDMNVVCACANCHRKVHGGLIKIFRWYLSTSGRVLHYFDEYGNEHFD